MTMTLVRHGADPAQAHIRMEPAYRCARTGLMVSVHRLPTSPGIAAQWRELAGRALVPNLFYEADFATAASLPFGKGVRVALAHTVDGTLVMAWPFRLARLRWGLPLVSLVGWIHPFASLGVPLIDATMARDALTCLLHLHRTVPGLPPRALLPQIPEEGPFAQLFSQIREDFGLRSAHLERFDRAFWKKDAPSPISSGTRSKLRQEYRRLEREGSVVFETLTRREEVVPALEDYLRLEAEGWKGRVGTAIPQSSMETEFMRQVVRDYAEQGRVRIDRLRIGQVTLASSITYLSGSHVWYAKISFNENFAKNSPGSQLVVKVTEQLQAAQAVATADSCAPPGHPLMRRFWGGRYSLANVVLELPAGDKFFPLAWRLEELRNRLRNMRNRVKQRLDAQRGRGK